MKVHIHKMNAPGMLSGTEMVRLKQVGGCLLKYLSWLKNLLKICVLPWPFCQHQWSIVIAQSSG